MRALQSWLRRYVDFALPPEELAEKLGMLGLEIESVERLGARFDRFVVASVLHVEKHPKADRLTVCAVDNGSERLQVVCGAPNVRAGQKVALGLPGAVIPRNQHDQAGKPMTLGVTSIRGVESHGMLCSEFELGMGEDAAGIMVLGAEAHTGMPLATYFGLDDVAYEMEVTPNRPDWLGHIGIAREIGVVTGNRLKLPRIRLRESATPARKEIGIRLEEGSGCSRFAARVIKGVHIGPSPDWLRRLMEGTGLRSVNNIVDITNFVMLETGQPLHAFDHSRLRGKQIVVRRKHQAGAFVTLDGNTVTVPAGTIMVCDAEREVSIAGVMGGAESAITEETVDILIESANWDPSSIRSATRALGIRTDASYRFERGADPNGVIDALNRAADLVLQTAGGVLLKGAVDVYPKKVRPRIITLRTRRVNEILGTSLSAPDIRSCLRPLGIARRGGRGDAIQYEVPTFRVDIEREIDLIEEVARVYGYDRIEARNVTPVVLHGKSRNVPVTSRIRDQLLSFGYHEAVTIPLIDRKRAEVSGIRPVELLNPLSAEMSVLRTSLIPGLLQAVAHNLRHGNANVRLFEVGHVFSRDASESPKLVEDFLEEERVAIALSGAGEPLYWGRSPRLADIFDLKGDLAGLMGDLSLDKCHFIPYSTSNALVDEAISITINGSNVGFLGRVNESTLTSYGIEHPVYVAEIQLQLLSNRRLTSYVPLPKFPRVRRDVAFILDSSIPSGDVEKAIIAGSSGLVKRADLFDLYEGDQAGPGKKSLAFALELVPQERTLTDEDIEKEMRQVTSAVEKACGAVLRGS